LPHFLWKLSSDQSGFDANVATNATRNRYAKGYAMRLVFGLVLMIGLGLAGGAVYMAQNYIGQNRAELEQERAARLALVPMADAFVVKRDIKYGEKISKEDVAFVQLPENALPEGTFQLPADLFPGDGSELRTALREIEKFEALTRSKVTEPGEIAGVSSSLKQGERAFAIKVDATSGVSGFLRPGDRVDVYWTGSLGTNAGEVTKLIEAAIRLIAVDQSANSERSSATIARTVTVAISPQQVAALAQAQATGRVSLSLVGATDNELAEAVEINQRQLLGIVEEQVVEAEKERVCTIKTRRGAEVVEIPIPCKDP
jgi:pilus assembly protein CpaB